MCWSWSDNNRSASRYCRHIRNHHLWNCPHSWKLLQIRRQFLHFCFIWTRAAASSCSWAGVSLHLFARWRKELRQCNTFCWHCDIWCDMLSVAVCAVHNNRNAVSPSSNMMQHQHKPSTRRQRVYYISMSGTQRYNILYMYTKSHTWATLSMQCWIGTNAGKFHEITTTINEKRTLQYHNIGLHGIHNGMSTKQLIQRRVEAMFGWVVIHVMIITKAVQLFDAIWSESELKVSIEMYEVDGVNSL